MVKLLRVSLKGYEITNLTTADDSVPILRTVSRSMSVMLQTLLLRLFWSQARCWLLHEEEQNIDTLGNNTVDFVFDNVGFQTYGICRERSSSPSGIMQIVTSAVRKFCECTVFPRIT